MADDILYGFTESGMRQLVTLVRRIQSDLQGQKAVQPVRAYNTEIIRICYAQEDISRLGSGLARVGRWDSTAVDDAATTESDQEEFTVVEVGILLTDNSPIPSGTRMVVAYFRGKWIIIDADCDAFSGGGA